MKHGAEYKMVRFSASCVGKTDQRDKGRASLWYLYLLIQLLIQHEEQIEILLHK